MHFMHNRIRTAVLSNKFNLVVNLGQLTDDSEM